MKTDMLSEGTHVALDGGDTNIVHQSLLPFMGSGGEEEWFFGSTPETWHHVRYKKRWLYGGWQKPTKNTNARSEWEKWLLCLCAVSTWPVFQQLWLRVWCHKLELFLSVFSPQPCLSLFAKALPVFHLCQKRSPDEPSKIVTTTFPAVVIMLPINSLSLEATEASLRNIFNFVLSSTSPSTPSPSSKSSS